MSIKLCYTAAAATETTTDAAASEGVKARVLYDFTAKEPTEMTLVKGQIVDVTSQVCNLKYNPRAS